MEDHVEVQLLKQKLQDDEMRYEQRISALEKRVDDINKTVLTGKIGLIVLIALGTFVGWTISVSATIRSWFH